LARFSLIPRQTGFFDKFKKVAQNNLDGAYQLRDMLTDYQNVELKAKELFATEHHGDKIRHEIIAKLNKTFVTPIDRDDIDKLSSALDDILDIMEAAGDTFVLYKIEKPTPEAIAMAEVLVKSVEEIQKAIDRLEDLKGLKEFWIEIHRLENEGDHLAREAIAHLFENGIQPVDVIKWKDIYEYLESAIDKCEDVANILESIVLKHA